MNTLQKSHYETTVLQHFCKFSSARGVYGKLNAETDQGSLTNFA